MAQVAAVDVAAVQGYCMAFRRSDAAARGPLDERFRFYRSADVELSFRVKDAGLRAAADLLRKGWLGEIYLVRGTMNTLVAKPESPGLVMACFSINI